MFQERKGYVLLVVVVILLCLNIFLLFIDLKDRNKGLTFAMLDVGQGDALFVESPTGTQILIDSGPSRQVLNELGKVMRPYDRTIDAIIITNPDADHIAGFLEILKRYKVGQVFEPGTFNNSKTYQNLEEEIKRKNIPNTLARQGMRLDLGGGAVLDVLFPDRDVSQESANAGSIVARLSYGETSIMLTGDATSETENIVLGDFRAEDLDSDLLKVGHHGSRTSSGEEFISVVTPKYALISSGADNRYGHPHSETLDTLVSTGAKILRTDLLGTVIMKSNGIEETFLYK